MAAPPNVITLKVEDLADRETFPLVVTLRRDSRREGGGTWVNLNLQCDECMDKVFDENHSVFVADYMPNSVPGLQYLDSHRWGPWQGSAWFHTGGYRPNLVLDDDGSLQMLDADGHVVRDRSGVGRDKRDWFILRPPEVEKLSQALLAFRTYYLTGAAREDRESVVVKRLGRRELLFTYTQATEWSSVSYFWFPESGSDTLYILGEHPGEESQGRLSTVTVELSRWGNTKQGELLRNAWNLVMMKAGSNAFPMKVTAHHFNRYDLKGSPPEGAQFVASVERRTAGKLKGVPLVRFSIVPFVGMERTLPWATLWRGKRLPRTGYAPSNSGLVFGPYTLQQLQAGTSILMPGRVELVDSRRLTGRQGGYTETYRTGWHIDVEDMQRIFVALDVRAEQGLSG